MAETSIEWTDWSVNPLRAMLGHGDGHYCEKTSPGCQNCYSSRTQPRFRMPTFPEQRRTPTPTRYLSTAPLEAVLRRRTPTRIFWCDMTDLFGDWVPDQWIAACLGIMAATPHHTHQLLTKRAARMPALMARLDARTCIQCALGMVPLLGQFNGTTHRVKRALDAATWPLPNVWLGVSAEDQQRADERLNHLRATPAAVRFVSVEPMLGPEDLSRFLVPCNHNTWTGDEGPVKDLGRWPKRWRCDGCGLVSEKNDQEPPLPGIDWVIVGGESGNGARPYKIAWGRDIIAQCRIAGVPVFHKQVGANAIAMGEHDLGPWQYVAWDAEHAGEPFPTNGVRMRTLDRKGGDPAEWPEDLRVREFPR